MRRPEWAGSRMFAPAWRGTIKELGVPKFRESASFVLQLLEEAHVIVIPAGQVIALPQPATTWESAEILAHERLPFDPLFIDYGRVHEAALFDQKRPANLEAQKDPQHRIGEVGPLLLTARRAPDWIVGPAATAFVVEEGHVLPDGSFHGAEVRADGTGYEIGTGATSQWGQERIEEGGDCDAATGDLAARILRFLNCINVELVDAPMSRQERRAAERNGSPIAQIVHIRQNRKHREPDERQKVDWSHRWEVRGHYKHFPQGTRLADAAPEKLSWEPARQEYVRRVWCPPYVKGPEGKPLLPKTHVVSA